MTISEDQSGDKFLGEKKGLLGWISAMADKVLLPIKKNGAFFFFMYLTGITCAWLTLHRKEPLYDNLYLELFLDLYLVCLVLTIIPQTIRRWANALLYIILYSVAVIDVYCFVKFDSTITPTMLLLVGETDGREAGEFLQTYLSPDILFSNVGWILLIMIIHIFKALRPRISHLLNYRQKIFLDALGKIAGGIYSKAILPLGIMVAGLLVWSITTSFDNKAATWKLFSARNIGEVEHVLTEPDHGRMYMPVYRLAFSIFSNELASKELDKLIVASNSVKVDSCSYTSPHIVLIIGESYSRHHDSQYGYYMPTAPRQTKREKNGLLVKFTDVVSPWNLTSYVFKNIFSMHVVGQKGTWADYPLFPELFRKAGYHTTFITNQFLPKAREAVYDFSGGFFLNNPTLSKAMFDTRNDKLHVFDEDLLKDYENLKSHDTEHNLTIFHLIGQHVNYRTRYPQKQRHFTGDDYKELKPNLNARERKILSDYDNACLYNDSVVDQVIKRFEKEDAIVIYMSDHGEECYEGDMHFICRMHSAAIDYRLAHAEFDIPFWIWCSRSYAKKRPEIFRQIREAKNKKFMTDALPHLLLYLGGIHSKDYHEEYNLISPKYNENRPRILKGTTDYDKLKKETK